MGYQIRGQKTIDPGSGSDLRRLAHLGSDLEARGAKYAIRIPANDSLERDIAELPARPVRRPSYKPAVKLTRPSCRRLRFSEARLWLSLIAYDLGNLWRLAESHLTRRLFGVMVRRTEALPLPAGQRTCGLEEIR